MLVLAPALLRAASFEATWSHLPETVPVQALSPEADLNAPSPVVSIRPLIAKTADQEIMLGYRRARLATARVNPVTARPDRYVVIEFVPGEDNTAVIEHFPRRLKEPFPRRPCALRGNGQARSRRPTVGFRRPVGAA